MKKLLIIIITISAIACKNEPPADFAIISGTILNINNPETLSINALDRSFTKKLKITSEGTFLDTLKTDSNNDYVLYDGKNPVFLYVASGDDIIINYDVKDFDNTLQITGEGSRINNYLVAKRAIEKAQLEGQRNVYKLNEIEFKELANNIADLQIEELEKTAGIPEDYIIRERRGINYLYLYLLSNYENEYRRQNRKPDFKVSEGFLTELETIDYDNDDDYNFSVYYKGLVNNYFYKKTRDIVINERLSNGMALIKSLSEITKPSKIKNALLYSYAEQNLTQESNIKAFYDAFMANSTNEEHKNKITEIFSKLKPINVGDPSPKFNYENNAGGTTSLDDLKGKYVYIDVWATWCGPCLREIPALKEVEKKFHGKNIEFVSISIDKKRDYDKWKKMIADRDLKGIQLIADNEWQSSFVQEYSIKGIPRFILVGPDGTIVNPNAPRPSSPNLVTLIESLEI